MSKDLNMIVFRDPLIPEEIHELYESSFPESEKVKWEELTSKIGRQASLFGFYQQEVLCGFMYLHQNDTNAHIGFFAVEKKLRGQGLGTEMLKMVSEFEKNRTISLEIEDTEEPCPDHDIRVKRKNFYLHAGFIDSGIRFYYQNMIWELLANRPITKAVHYHLIHDVFPKTADDFIYFLVHQAD